jgi:hypothetical protein
MGIKICDWWMSLLQHSCCKTHIFTKTFEATFTHWHWPAPRRRGVRPEEEGAAPTYALPV